MVDAMTAFTVFVLSGKFADPGDSNRIH